MAVLPRCGCRCNNTHGYLVQQASIPIYSALRDKTRGSNLDARQHTYRHMRLARWANVTTSSSIQLTSLLPATTVNKTNSDTPIPINEVKHFWIITYQYLTQQLSTLSLISSSLVQPCCRGCRTCNCVNPMPCHAITLCTADKSQVRPSQASPGRVGSTPPRCVLGSSLRWLQFRRGSADRGYHDGTYRVSRETRSRGEISGKENMSTGR